MMAVIPTSTRSNLKDIALLLGIAASAFLIYTATKKQEQETNCNCNE